MLTRPYCFAEAQPHINAPKRTGKAPAELRFSLTTAQKYSHYARRAYAVSSSPSSSSPKSYPSPSSSSSSSSWKAKS